MRFLDYSQDSHPLIIDVIINPKLINSKPILRMPDPSQPFYSALALFDRLKTEMFLNGISNQSPLICFKVFEIFYSFG